MPRIIRGTKGNDQLDGTEADERLVGGAGNDQLIGNGGHDDLYGGTGSDYLSLWGGTGRALGGKGNDYLTSTGGDDYTLAGGVGNDLVQGTGRLFGDERPGLPQRTVGNDLLQTDMLGEGHSTHTGGLGADVFNARTFFDGQTSSLTVTDFTPGQDKLAVSLQYMDEPGTQLRPFTVFSILDTNRDGFLGNDTPGDGNSSATLDASGLTIRLHEDIVTILGVDTLRASDWAF